MKFFRRTIKEANPTLLTNPSMASTLEKVSGSNNYIPDDIVFSILSKLSIKSLKRFSCVRKSWSHLFENSDFINMFRNNFLSKSHSPYDDDDDDDACFIFSWFQGPMTLSFRMGDKFEKEIKLDPPPPFCIHQNGTFIRVLSSAVDGIVCIYDGFNDSKLVLWNPATNEVYVVPPNVPECLPNVRAYFCNHGFGYDHVSDDYKVIRYVNVDSQEDVPMASKCFWEIYSLRSNSWRQLNVDMPYSYVSAETSNVYVNGVCHWLLEEDDEIYLVSFNLSNEVFFKTHFDKRIDFCFNLVVLNGSVAMISNYQWTTSFSISILGEIGVKESWIRLFEFGPLASIYSPINYSPIAAGKKGNIFFKRKGNKLGCCFYLTTGVIEEIIDNENRNFGDITIYKKKLHPIKEINE